MDDHMDVNTACLHNTAITVILFLKQDQHSCDYVFGPSWNHGTRLSLGLRWCFIVTQKHMILRWNSDIYPLRQSCNGLILSLGIFALVCKLLLQHLN